MEKIELCGPNGSGISRHSNKAFRELQPELFLANHSALYPIKFKKEILEWPTHLRELLWSYLCKPASNLYYFKEYIQVNMIYQRQEDNLAWHKDFPPNLWALNDFSPLATIGEVMLTEFATIWRYRPQNWKYVCLGWGMFDKEGRFCPAGAVTKKSSCCRKSREDSDDKCNI